MKTCPFRLSPQRVPWYEREIADKFEAVRRDAERRLSEVAIRPDGRIGFGVVYATGELWHVDGVLSSWFWRPSDAEHLPKRLGASCFFDDPMGAAPTDALVVRAAAATAFADAANAYFDPDDGRFHAISLEIVEAVPELPEGLHHIDGADVLSIDLMGGLSNARVIDRLLEAEHKWDPAKARWDGGDCVLLRLFLWHRVDRLNAARAALRPSLPKIKLPGLPAVRRRLLAAEQTVRHRAGTPTIATGV